MHTTLYSYPDVNNDNKDTDVMASTHIRASDATKRSAQRALALLNVIRTGKGLKPLSMPDYLAVLVNDDLEKLEKLNGK